MGCERYLADVRTASGLTLANRRGAFLGLETPTDLHEWKVAAEGWLSILVRNVDIHQAVAGASEWPGKVELYEQQLASLPWVGCIGDVCTSPGASDADVEKAADLTRNIACDVGVMEDELRALDAKPEIPIGPRGAGAASGSLGLLLLGLAALYYFTRET